MKYFFKPNYFEMFKITQFFYLEFYFSYFSISHFSSQIQAALESKYYNFCVCIYVYIYIYIYIYIYFIKISYAQYPIYIRNFVYSNQNFARFSAIWKHDNKSMFEKYRNSIKVCHHYYDRWPFFFLMFFATMKGRKWTARKKIMDSRRPLGAQTTFRYLYLC